MAPTTAPLLTIGRLQAPQLSISAVCLLLLLLLALRIHHLIKTCSGDVVTTPTPSMLQAIQRCTLLDDVFREDPTTNSLESYIAELTGKKAAVLVLSGTMGNQIAIRTHLTQPPHSVLADHRSHIYEWYFPPFSISTVSDSR